MDKGADIHVAHLGGCNTEAQLFELLVGEGFTHQVLPYLLANLIIHIGRNLSDALLAFVVIFHFISEFGEALVGNGLSVNLTHVGDATVVLGEVTDNECNDSHTDDEDGYPRIFSNTSYNSHL